MNISKSIKIALLKEEKQVSWLAEKVGINYQNLTRMIRIGNLSIENAKKISSALGMSIDELIALGEPENESK